MVIQLLLALLALPLLIRLRNVIKNSEYLKSSSGQKAHKEMYFGEWNVVQEYFTQQGSLFFRISTLITLFISRLPSRLTLGFPCTILQLGHNSRIIFAKFTFLNSFQLSLCNIWGEPIREKMSKRVSATSIAVLALSGRRTTNLVKWS